MEEEIATSTGSPVVSNAETETTNGTGLEKTNKSEAVWQPCWDAGTGSYYYWNVVTNETTWTRPPASALYSSASSGNSVNGISSETDFSRPSFPGGGGGEAYPGFDPRTPSDLNTRGGGAGTLVIPTTSFTTTIGSDVVDAFFENIERVKRQRLETFSQSDVSFSGSGRGGVDEPISIPVPSITTISGKGGVGMEGEKQEQVEEDEEEVEVEVEGVETEKIIKEFEEKYGYHQHHQHQPPENGGYSSKGRYNPLTGVFEADPQLVGPERFSAAARMQRQCDFFFDYQAYALQRGLDPEAGKVKMSKKELARAIRRSKVKREMKKKKWLLGID